MMLPWQVVALVWLAYAVCIAGAVSAYSTGPQLLYGAWSWFGGATFTILVSHYQQRWVHRKDRR